MNVQTVPQRHRITVDEYHRMEQAGIFTEDDRMELIEGEIIDMAPIGNAHASAVRKLIHLLSDRIQGKAVLDVQNPLHLDDCSEPQPDVVLLKPRRDFYAAHTPRAEDVLLLIEIADTSLPYDREVKIPLYARHGISEIWLVNLQDRLIEVFRQPTPQGYRQRRQHHPGEPLQAGQLTTVRLDPVELFTP